MRVIKENTVLPTTSERKRRKKQLVRLTDSRYDVGNVRVLLPQTNGVHEVVEHGRAVELDEGEVVGGAAGVEFVVEDDLLELKGLQVRTAEAVLQIARP